MSIYNNIKTLRKHLGLKQTEFAKKLNMTSRGIQKWESAKVEIKESSLMLIQQVYNVSPSWLRTGVGDMFLNDDNVKSDKGILNTNSLSLKQTFVVNAIKQMSEKEIEDLLKYIDDKEAAKKYRDMLKKEQAG